VERASALRELRERNYAVATDLTDWLRPQRSATRVWQYGASRPAPGKQAQWTGAFGTLGCGQNRSYTVSPSRWVKPQEW